MAPTTALTSSNQGGRRPNTPHLLSTLILAKKETPKNKRTSKQNKTASRKGSKLQDREEQKVQLPPGHPSRSPGQACCSVLDVWPQLTLRGLLSATLSSKVKGVRVHGEALQFSARWDREGPDTDWALRGHRTHPGALQSQQGIENMPP